MINVSRIPSDDVKRQIRFHVLACLNKSREDNVIRGQVRRSHGGSAGVTAYTDAQITRQRVGRAAGTCNFCFGYKGLSACEC